MLTTLTRVQSVEIQVSKTTTQTIVPLVYVAAPYSEPDPVANTKHAIRIADALLQAGFTPLVPHLTMLWDIVSPKPYEEWLDYDRELLARCDAVLRVPGYSVGATREVRFAESLRIPVTSVAFSPDGQWIVSGSHDKTARVWDAKSAQSLFELLGHKEWVTGVAYSPDGQQIVTRDLIDRSRVWNAMTGALIPDAKIPDTLEEGRISPDKKFLLLPRFKKVLVIPLDITPKDQEERKARTCPRPNLHRMEAKSLEANGEQFAAQIQLALVQQALGQELADEAQDLIKAKKPDEAQAKLADAQIYFDKAKQLRPKPVPQEMAPMVPPTVKPPG